MLLRYLVRFVLIGWRVAVIGYINEVWLKVLKVNDGSEVWQGFFERSFTFFCKNFKREGCALKFVKQCKYTRGVVGDLSSAVKLRFSAWGRWLTRVFSQFFENNVKTHLINFVDDPRRQNFGEPCRCVSDHRAPANTQNSTTLVLLSRLSFFLRN